MAGWRPSPGNSVHGTVVALQLSMPNRYGQYPIVTVRTENGSTVDVHAFHGVLKNQLQALRPDIGDTITITYDGRQEGKEYEYHKYTVDVEGKSPDIWGAPTTTMAPSGTSDIPDARDDDDAPF